MTTKSTKSRPREVKCETCDRMIQCGIRGPLPRRCGDCGGKGVFAKAHQLHPRDSPAVIRRRVQRSPGRPRIHPIDAAKVKAKAEIAALRERIGQLEITIRKLEGDKSLHYMYLRAEQSKTERLEARIADLESHVLGMEALL